MNKIKQKSKKITNKTSSFFGSFFLIVFTVFIVLNSRSVTQAREVFIVAKINNQVVTNLDLLDRYRLLILTSKISSNSKEEKLMLLNQILQKMIDEKLQTEEAIKSNIGVSSEELSGALEKIAKDQKKSPESLKKFLLNNNLSYQNYVEQVKSQILWNKMIVKLLPPKIRISNSDVEEMIELSKINANIAQFFLAEIYIPFDYKISDNKIDAGELAAKLVTELKNGRDFGNIVKQFSRSPTAEFKGEIGWIGKNEIDSKIYDQISKLKLNEISQPVIMNNGYYIFKLLKKRVANNVEDEDIKEIRNVIFSKKMQNAAKSYLIDLRKKSYIEIGYLGLKELANGD